MRTRCDLQELGRMSSPPHQPEVRTRQKSSGPIGPQILVRWGAGGRFWKQQAMHVQGGGRTHHPAQRGGCFAVLLLVYQPRSCRHSTDSDDYARQKYPWTLAQSADPRARTYDHGSSHWQLTVAADWLDRRPCSFALPPFSGLAFSSSFSSSCLVRCKAPVR